MIDEGEEYGITEGHARVPKWLIATYILLPIWGIIWIYFFWNGSVGILDQKHWQQLERAANTTYPVQDLTYGEKR